MTSSAAGIGGWESIGNNEKERSGIKKSTPFVKYWQKNMREINPSYFWINLSYILSLLNILVPLGKYIDLIL